MFTTAMQIIQLVGVIMSITCAITLVCMLYTMWKD